MKRLFSICFFCLFAFVLSAQTEKELRHEVNIQKDTAKITAYLNLANYYYLTTGSTDSLLFYGNKSLVLARKKKSRSHEITAHIFIGTHYQSKQDYPKSEFHWKLAAQKARELKDNRKIIDIENKLGVLYHNWEKLDKAIPHFLKAAKSAEALKDYDNACFAYYGVSSIYAILNQDEKRLEYIEKALDLIRHHKVSDINQIIVFTYASQHYLELQNNSNSYLDSANYYANKGLALATKLGWDQWKPSCLNVLSAIAFEKRKFTESKRLIAEALLYKDALKEDTKFSLYLRKAAIAIEDNETELAQASLKIAESSSVMKEDYFQLNYAEVAHNVFKKSGDFESAMKALEMRERVQSKMHAKENEKLVFDLETKYRTEIKDAEIGSLQQQRVINRLELEKKRTQLSWIIGIGAIVLLIAVIVVFVFRQRVANQKIKHFETEQRLNRARMDPHFFFNALSSVQTLALTEQSPKTVLLLSKFTKIMRQSLESTYNEMVTIEDDLMFNTRYLEMQQIRHPNKFEYQIDVDATIEEHEVLIPSMLLQPFIENAIEHGFKSMDTGGKLSIFYTIKDTFLTVEIIDNGKEDTEAHEGKVHISRATQIVKDRLFLLNKQTGKKADFEIANGIDSKGYRIQLNLPLIYKA